MLSGVLSKFQDGSIVGAVRGGRRHRKPLGAIVFAAGKGPKQVVTLEVRGRSPVGPFRSRWSLLTTKVSDIWWPCWRKDELGT